MIGTQQRVLFRNLPTRIDEWIRFASIRLALASPLMMRYALGIVFAWYGALKFFPGLSPAEDLAGRTIAVLTAHHLAPSVSVPMLGAWETAIGSA
jgi:hypothetical protein